MKAAKDAGADLAEIRVDLLDASQQARWAEVIRGGVLPVIVTNRPEWEGGKSKQPEEERLQVLIEASQLGAAYIDVELAAVDTFAKLCESKAPIAAKRILSHHDFEAAMSLDEVRTTYKRMVAAGADVCKIAMAASSATDNATVFAALKEASDRPLILLAMGELGQCSRILAPKYGAYLTFASVGKGRESAPGQVATETLVSLYRFDSISASTHVFGVIGNPVSHSMSPALHNAALQAAGIDAVYVPLKVDDDVPGFIKAMVPFDFYGFSVTIPGKVPALDAMDHVEETTAKIGAMNTVVRKPGDALHGFNTDWVAAISAIEDALRDAGKSLSDCHVLCIGAGGAARGLAYGSLARGAKRVTIANRTVEKAEALAADIGSGADAMSLQALTAPGAPTFDVIMNTTSVGMHPNVDHSPVPQAILRETKPLVFDAVYNPLETKLLCDAKEEGCICVSGLEMFVRQAAEQFRLWFPDQVPDVGLMRSVVLARLQQA